MGDMFTVLAKNNNPVRALSTYRKYGLGELTGFLYIWGKQFHRKYASKFSTEITLNANTAD